LPLNQGIQGKSIQGISGKKERYFEKAGRSKEVLE